MRTKEIDIEGQKFTIAPLTIAQVEELTDGVQPGPDDAKAWKARALQTVCDGLANASPDAPQTPDGLRNSMDLLTYNALHSAILEFSGLKTVAMGETLAAPDSTSATSAAA